MTKILNLVQPPNPLFVKHVTAALCISWSLKMKDGPRVLLNHIWKLTNVVKENSYLILTFVSILTSWTWIFKMLLNYCTETEVEKLTDEIIEVGPGIWGMCGNSHSSLSLHVRCKVRKASFYTLFIAMGRENIHWFVGLRFNGSKRNRKVLFGYNKR